MNPSNLNFGLVGLLFSLQIIACGNYALAQSSPQDCDGAQLVCDDFNVPSSYMGMGFQWELDTTNSSCLSLGEENSVWFKFFTATAGQLIFEIIPNNTNDDYDYALYNADGVNCEDMLESTAYELRCNYSAAPGNTGCDTPYTNLSSSAGGANQCAAIDATVGQGFLLVINNHAGSTSGFSLDFSGDAVLEPCSPTGLFPVTKECLRIYPNPSAGDFLLSCASPNAKGNFRLLNEWGQVIYEIETGNEAKSSYAIHLPAAVVNGFYLALFNTAAGETFTTILSVER